MVHAQASPTTPASVSPRRNALQQEERSSTTLYALLPSPSSLLSLDNHLPLFIQCPNLPEDIKCCTKPACGASNAGNCRLTSSCDSGITETNKCPGPDSFKCCMPSSSSGGDDGYPTPTFPSSSSGCKSVAIAGAKTIVEQFPGKVKEIGCIRDCGSGETSDHCVGMATDLMVGEGGVGFPFLFASSSPSLFICTALTASLPISHTMPYLIPWPFP